MSFWRLTQQSSNPPQPGPENTKKTLRVFVVDVGGNPVIKTIDSDGNINDFTGPAGSTGPTGPTGPIGPPGTISSQFVADILNPTEIESLTLAGVGRELIAHEVIAPNSEDFMTVYSYDADGPAKNAPYVMNTGDGGTTRWISRGGRFHQTPPDAANGDRFITAAEQTKLTGIEAGAEVNPANLAFTNADNNFSTVQTFQNNAKVQGQAFSEANTLTDEAIISIDLNTGNVQTVTLGGNRTLQNPTNLKNGGTYIFIIKQDLTGNRTLVYDTAFKFEGGIAPTLSTAASSVDLLSCVSDGSSLFCQLIKDFQ